MIGYPKPAPKVKEKRPLARSKPIPRKTRIKQGNAYQEKTWRALARAAHKRSGGICERIGCCRPVSGDPNHLGYADFDGPQRLIVPLAWVSDDCPWCHVAFHVKHGHRKSLPVYRPGVPAPYIETAAELRQAKSTTPKGV